jgi:hypothetical protein
MIRKTPPFPKPLHDLLDYRRFVPWFKRHKHTISPSGSNAHYSRQWSREDFDLYFPAGSTNAEEQRLKRRTWLGMSSHKDILICQFAYEEYRSKRITEETYTKVIEFIEDARNARVLARR